MSTLNYRQVREEYLKMMQEHITFTTGSTTCTPEMVLDILGLAAVDQASVHSTCNMMADGPTSAAVLYQLRQGWLDGESLANLETQLNTLLASRLPPRIRGRHHAVAIDLTLIPYHGQPWEQPEEIRRSAAKSGTTHFHVYASAYLVRKHKRVTLAVAYYQAHETLLGLLQRLLARLRALDVGLKRLLLDRQFYTVQIFRYLQQQAWQSLIPVPARSHRLKELRHTARRSHQRRYTMSSAQEGQVTFALHVVCSYAQGRRGKHGIDVSFFAVLGVPWTGSARRVARTYARRFGIETSYRLMNAMRIRTTSRDPKLRLLYAVLAFVLLNLWVFLLWTVLAVPRQGGRYLAPGLFRLAQFRYFLRDAIRELRRPTHSISRPTCVF